jgi:vacuolar protein sorting-associated protein VTA1
LTDLFKGKYQVVNQILAKGLHNADQDSNAYTTRLMDDLEQVRVPHLATVTAMSWWTRIKFKADNQTNDAVTDDVAGKVYVEQFALDTFQRADNAVRANKASR